MIFLENAESGTYTLKVTGTGKGKYTVVVGQITADHDYWEQIAGEITRDPASSQTDTYTINYPSSPLSPTGSKPGTGSSGSSTTPANNTAIASTPTPTPLPRTAATLIDNILGASTELESSKSASPSGKPANQAFPAYQSPHPSNPWKFILALWLTACGVLLLAIPWHMGKSKRTET